MVMITICGGVPVDFTKDADGQVYFLDGKLVDKIWRPSIHLYKAYMQYKYVIGNVEPGIN